MKRGIFIVLMLFFWGKDSLGQVNITASPNESCGGTPVTLTAGTPVVCDNYTISSIGYSTRTLTVAATVVSLGDDQVSGALPIGFTFNFFCNNYTNFYISSNGFITFSGGQSSGCCSGQNLPNTSSPNNLIAFAWEDLDPGNGGQPAVNLIRYETQGVSPNRELIVEFYNVDHYPSGNRVTVQAILHESGNIEIQTTTMPSDGGSHTMGIENAGGTIAFAVAGRNSSNWSASNEGVLFTKQSSCTGVTYDWQQPLGTSIGSGNTITVTPLITTTYYCVTNSSCGTITGSKTIKSLFVNAGNDQCTGGGTITLYPTTNFPANCNSYDVASIGFSARTLTAAATTVSLGDDQVSGALPIGFTFNFFCSNYTTFYISSNGFITFSGGQSSGCCSGQNLPNTSSPNNLIAFAWEDIDPGNGGQPAVNLIRYETQGVSPNRELIVEFYNVDHYPSGNRITVQTILHESDYSIEVQTTAMPSDGGNHTMGLENSGGTTAFTVAGRNSANWSASNEGIRFSQKNNSVVTWSPATGLSSTTVLNPNATPLVSTNYTITIDNGAGCVLSDVVNVNPACPLPIELVSFTGSCDGNSFLFNWATASEIDNDYFTIEQLDEKTQQWYSVAQIEGAGNSVQWIDYSYSVKLNVGKKGYFRLKQTDYDGKYSYSKVIYINCNEVGNVSGFPNPTSRLYTLDLNSLGKNEKIIVIQNSLGKTIDKRTTRKEIEIIDVAKYTKGMYYVTISSDNFSKVLKMMVQ